MPKWKLQAVEPDTCDAPGCRYIELWDSLVPDNQRVIRIAAFERMCPAHFDPDVPTGVLLWEDGNWKDLAAYIDYQREWFRRLNHIEWLQNHPGEAMPPQIAGFVRDPITPGSVAPPGQAKKDAMDRVYGWNREHNMRKNLAVNAMRVETGRQDLTATWTWEGTGSSRVLRISGGLTNQQRSRVQSVLNIQFGVGLALVDA